jgi:hypothetical protein
MDKKITFYDGPTDFSLVQGGPLFQFFLRTGLLKPPTDLLARRIVMILLIAWIPPFVFSILSGHAFGGSGVPFLYDLGDQIRLLLCMPLLLASDVLVHRRIKMTVRQFLDRGLVAPEDQPKFESLITSAMKLRNSTIVEVLMLAIAIGSGSWFGGKYLFTKTGSWLATPANGHFELTTAGYYYLFVSLGIFRFLLLRWYFRLFIWYRFLWQVSRQIPLRLNALHSDRAGGLAFLSGSMFAFVPVLLAHTIGIAGSMGGMIWHEGATVPQFKLEICVWMAYLMLLVIAPLCFFAFQLAAAKRAGLREYGIVASRYVTEFRRKWIEGHSAKDEPLVGSGDIQSLADLSNSFDVVQEMRMVPFGRAAMLRLALFTASPFLLLVPTMIPIEQLIDRAIGVFL